MSAHSCQIKKITFLQVLVIFAACLFLKRELDMISEVYLQDIYYPKNSTHPSKEAIAHTIDLHRTFYGYYDSDYYEDGEDDEGFDGGFDEKDEDFEPTEVYRPNLRGEKKNHPHKKHHHKTSEEVWPEHKRGPYAVSNQGPKKEKKMDKQSIIGKLLPKEYKSEKLTYKQALTLSK